MDLFSLEGRTALVTGASSGLGVRLAKALDSAGARVVLVARRRAELEKVAADLHDAVALTADLTDERARTGVLDEIERRFGALDILVNNAGTTAVGPAEDEPLATFQSVLRLNLEVPFAMSQACARLAWAASRELSIINITSVMGSGASRGVPQASYTASKAALDNLTRELANQWARRSIRVNAIAPGWFPSEITMAEMFDDPAGARFIRRNTPMGRAGEPGELDGAVIFLASRASSYVTGHVLTVDGGWSIV